MKTKDALEIGRALGRINSTIDAWEESKHPRADNGQFTSGAGGGGGTFGAKSEKARADKMLTAGQKRERASSRLSMNSKEWGNKGEVVFKEGEFPDSIKVNGKPFYKEANGELNAYGDDGNKGYGQAYFGNGYKAYVDACGRVRTEKTSSAGVTEHKVTRKPNKIRNRKPIWY